MAEKKSCAAAGSSTADPASIVPIGRTGCKLRILLAEDAPANQILSKHILSRRGHAVVTADDGAKALDLMRYQDFDVVLMDVQMPVMDGLEATAAIRALPDAKKAKVPIIALTAHALKEDQDRCLGAGMNAYLSKPFQAHELIGAVERAVESLAASDTERTVEPIPKPDVPQPTTTAAPVIAFSLTEGIARSLGKYDLFRQMVEFFYQEADLLVERIRKAAGDGDADEVAYAAHRFKGTIAYLGSRPASESVERVERIGRSGDLSEVGEAIEALAKWVAILKDALVAHRTQELPREGTSVEK